MRADHNFSDGVEPAEATSVDDGPGVSRSVGITVGVAVFLLLSVIGAYMLYGTPQHEIVTPNAAGGLTRDLAAERSNATKFDSWRFSLTEPLGGASASVDIVTAVYGGRRTTGTSVRLMFVGGTGDLGDPDDVVQKLTRWGGTPMPDTGGFDDPEETDSGALCVSYPYNKTNGVVDTDIVGMCAWATENSFGVLISPDPDGQLHLKENVDRMRQDLENEISWGHWSDRAHRTANGPFYPAPAW